MSADDESAPPAPPAIPLLDAVVVLVLRPAPDAAEGARSSSARVRGLSPAVVWSCPDGALAALPPSLPLFCFPEADAATGLVEMQTTLDA